MTCKYIKMYFELFYIFSPFILVLAMMGIVENNMIILLVSVVYIVIISLLKIRIKNKYGNVDNFVDKFLCK